MHNFFFTSFINILLLLLFILYVFFRLWKWDKETKRKIQQFLSFKFKEVIKVAEMTQNIKNTFGSETAKECTIQQWFTKFCNREEGLKRRRIVAGYGKLTTN